MTATLPDYLPYCTVDTGATVDEVFAVVNQAVWAGYGCDYRIVGLDKVVIGAAHDFVELCRVLASHPRAEFCEHWRMLREPCPPDTLRVGIRHDIDSDIVAALQQAEIEHEFGIVANFVVLHTAPYYGSWNPESQVFERNDSMIDVYRRFHELGHEVSLHTDPLFLYQTHGVDGAAAVRAEIEWFRSHGIPIRGTTAHNHRPTYGAENYEVFKRILAPTANAHPLDATMVEHHGKVAPLRVLDEAELGLEYEGNELMWQRSVPQEYGAARFANQWRWNAHLGRRRRRPEAPETYFVDQQRLFLDIADLEPGRFLILVVHPEYYGARTHAGEAPPRRVDQVKTIESDAGWRTYRPWSIVAASGGTPDAQEYQAIAMANEIGMLDFPHDDPLGPARTVVVTGGRNVDGRAVPMPVHLHARLMSLATERSETRVRARKFAFPGMGLDRLWPWMVAHLDTLRPDTVVLGIGGEGIRSLDPATWDRREGGQYLTVDMAGSIQIASTAHDGVPTVGDLTAHAVRLYAWAIDQLRARGIDVALLIDDDGDSARAAVAQLVAGTGITVLDPYARFAELDPRLAVHYADGSWTPTAHRIAGELLFAHALPGTTTAVD